MLATPTDDGKTRFSPKNLTPKSVSPKKTASEERRVGMTPIPESIDLYLNKEQLDSLQTMEYFGWQLVFVRRNDLTNIVPVIQSVKTKEYAVLDTDGDIIRSPNIEIRH